MVGNRSRLAYCRPGAVVSESDLLPPESIQSLCRLVLGFLMVAGGGGVGAGGLPSEVKVFGRHTVLEQLAQLLS